MIGKGVYWGWGGWVHLGNGRQRYGWSSYTCYAFSGLSSHLHSHAPFFAFLQGGPQSTTPMAGVCVPII